MAFVYLIESDGLVKVGVARDPEKRLCNLQIGCPSELRLIAKRDFGWREQARAAETGIHEELRGQRVRGEWYRPKPIDPAQMLDIYHTEHRLIVANRLACA